MTKHYFMFLLGVFLSAMLFGQRYSGDVVFLQQKGNTLSVRAVGISEKKKETELSLIHISEPTRP